MTVARFQLVTPDEITEPLRAQIRSLDETTDWGPDPHHPPLIYRGPPRWGILVWVGSQLVGRVAVIERNIRVGEQTLPVAGIGGVTTAVPYQSQGLASRALAQATEFIQREMNVDFALLTCRDHRLSFYRERGWQLLPQPVYCEQPDGRTVQLNIPGQNMMGKAFTHPLPSEAIHIQGLPF